MKSSTATQRVIHLAADLAAMGLVVTVLDIAGFFLLSAIFLAFASIVKLYSVQRNKPSLNEVQELRGCCLASWGTACFLWLLNVQAWQYLCLGVLLPITLIIFRHLLRQCLHLSSHPLVVAGEIPDSVRQSMPGQALNTFPYQVIKAIPDFLLGTALLILTLPLFILLAVILKLTSPGSVLYFSKRLGKSEKPFNLIKFRSMTPQADAVLQRIMEQSPHAAINWKQNFKLEDDPRITPVGKFLRETSLDELPQLWNVLKGDMALVGPRPIVTDERPLYGEQFKTFSSVKPGITGLWQVSGRNDLTYPQRVRLDVFYIQHWSPWLDLYIILKTVLEILSAHGR